MTDENVAELGKRIDAIVAELRQLTERIDRALKILTDEGSVRLQAQVELDTKLTKTKRDFAAAQATTDKMVESLDDRVGKYRDEVVEERAERLASSVPPAPAPPPPSPPARFPPPFPKKGEE